MDFYTLEYLKNKMKKLSFLEVQRLAYPLFDVDCLSTLSSVILDEYNSRLYEKNLQHEDASIENLILSVEKNNGFECFSYEDLQYLKTVIKSVVYYGKVQKVPESFLIDYLGTMIECAYIKENNSGYLHYEYDQKLVHLNELIKKELNKRYCKKTLKKYGIDNFDNMSYDDIENLINSMAYTCSINIDKIKNTKFSKLFKGLLEILGDMDEYMLPCDLNAVNYKKIKFDRLKRLQCVLDLSLNLSTEDALLYIKNSIDTSDVVINVEDLNEAFIVCENNSNEDIDRALKNVQSELSSRKNKTYIEEACYMYNDSVNQTKVKRF